MHHFRVLRFITLCWTLSFCCSTLLTKWFGQSLGSLHAQQLDQDIEQRTSPVKLVVLGVAQDGGYPQAGCQKACCAKKWDDLASRRWVSCVAIVDEESGERWLLDCTPDFREQLRLLDTLAPRRGAALIDGIFPTHAHVGHYAGLIHLGREVLGARGVPVYAMPRMKFFLETNGPWSQLTKLEQIQIKRLSAGSSVELNERIRVTPFLVPHRDEFSETVGFQIDGPERSALYLPDIDKWERWAKPIEDAVAEVDVALLDGTFFSAAELPGRDLSEIPHPLIEESLTRFEALSAIQREKIYFIHLNHSNPALDKNSSQAALVNSSGCHLARQGDVIGL